jgi:hypothetical protein
VRVAVGIELAPDSSRPRLGTSENGRKRALSQSCFAWFFWPGAPRRKNSRTRWPLRSCFTHDQQTLPRQGRAMREYAATITRSCSRDGVVDSSINPMRQPPHCATGGIHQGTAWRWGR